MTFDARVNESVSAPSEMESMASESLRSILSEERPSMTDVARIVTTPAISFGLVVIVRSSLYHVTS